ncbi:DNA-3-methyladenine glycosylase I [Rhizobiales bacterium GAS188]|nr:DNA-3-methyladenine glycosylase I [Rhizobiales bacterium GAS188]
MNTKLIAFATIKARAEVRKGGAAALAAALPPVPDSTALRAMPDAHVLAEMTRRVFCAGFVWQVIEAKWEGFEAAFSGFDPAFLAFAPDEHWERLTADSRIVRNGSKIMAVRTNARFVRDLAAEHGSAGRFLADWPARDQIGLQKLLSKRGGRLGGMTGQYLLRFLGRDTFMLSTDVVACLRDAGLPISKTAISQSDLSLAQTAFNHWASETGLPLTHLSRICALSIGENRAADE